MPRAAAASPASPALQEHAQEDGVRLLGRIIATEGDETKKPGDRAR
jgi:hypothetical protein